MSAESGETVVPADEMPKSAQDIVRALAATDIYDASDGNVCRLCESPTALRGYDHEPDCPWLLARAAVAEWDGAVAPDDRGRAWATLPEHEAQALEVAHAAPAPSGGKPE